MRPRVQALAPPRTTPGNTAPKGSFLLLLRTGSLGQEKSLDNGSFLASHAAPNVVVRVSRRPAPRGLVLPLNGFVHLPSRGVRQCKSVHESG